MIQKFDEIQNFDNRDPVEALAEEFLSRRRNGEQPTVKEYMDAHPSLAEQIRTHFPTILMLEQFKSCSLSSSGSVSPIPQVPPDQLGDFHLLREIGRGGMATVYEAEQESLQRRVAVKVFPQNTLLDSHELHRFHREARTAARLHHTNIVPVFGVGEQEGWHYFVMQRINGVSVDEAIQKLAARERVAGNVEGSTVASGSNDEVSAGAVKDRGSSRTSAPPLERPPTSPDAAPPGGSSGGVAVESLMAGLQQRKEWNWVAQLGVQVAEAVAYAHAQGVLHRDIKPGNLLLDERGVVWVSDFGLATLMHSDEVGDHGKIVGTIRFMAPEQIRGLTDARSDIYSLGATLYELLTRKPAFHSRSRSRMIDQILHGEFTPPRELRSSIPRDLEAIVLKSMAKDPEERFQSAEELAADLHRFIDGRSVVARRMHPLERVQRWARRSPAIASLTAALVLVGVGSFALISSKWRDAVAENRRAENNLSLALESMDHILGRFTSSWMADPNTVNTQAGGAADPAVGFQMVVSNHNAVVLEDALDFYAAFAKQNPTDPRLQRDIAKVHHRVGEIYSRLGQFDHAQDAYQRALLIIEQQTDHARMPLALEWAQTLNQLGLTLHAKSRFREAESQFNQAVKILSDRSLTEDPECQCELARTFTNLGHAQGLTLQRNLASDNHGRAIALLESVVDDYPENVRYRLALARAYRAYHPLVAFGRERREAERIRIEGVSILEALVADHPDVPDYQCELSEMLIVTSYRRSRFRETDGEIERLERAIRIARKLTETHPSVPRYRAVLANALKESARVIGHARGDVAAGHALESLTHYRALVREFGEIPAYRILLAMALQNHADLLRRRGQPLASRPFLEEGVREQRVYVQLRPENEFGLSVLARLEADLMRLPTPASESQPTPVTTPSAPLTTDGPAGTGAANSDNS